ncbi:MAG TPA: glycerophosphodiester phosphodiesterase family protein [Burkholderiales bacterium]|nr:glycerophosphodiester phosphodiesterase family protein [Burkholderiales bacterium]
MTIPQLVAHRGYTLRYPENTLIGVEAAIRAGARYVEIDVQLSADQVPVLFHDAKLTRVCGEPGAVHDYTAAQLKRFKAMEFNRFGYKFATERVATLAEFAELLARYPGVTGFIELKREALERFGPTVVLSRMRRALETIQKRCVIISFDLPVLAAARSQWPAIGAVVETWREREQTAIKGLKPQFLFCDVKGLPRFGRLRFGETHIVIYEVANPALALKLARRGVGFIETFAIGEMHESLNP